MFWNRNKDGNHLANLFLRLDFGDKFPFQMGIRKVGDLDSKFGWVFLFFQVYFAACYFNLICIAVWVIPCVPYSCGCWSCVPTCIQFTGCHRSLLLSPLLLWFACEGICLGRSPSFSPALFASLLSVHFVTACPLHHFHLNAPLLGRLFLLSEERVRLDTTTTRTHTK